jgi:hypothetical protein
MNVLAQCSETMPPAKGKILVNSIRRRRIGSADARSNGIALRLRVGEARPATIRECILRLLRSERSRFTSVNESGLLRRRSCSHVSRIALAVVDRITLASYRTEARRYMECGFRPVRDVAARLSLNGECLEFVIFRLRLDDPGLVDNSVDAGRRTRSALTSGGAAPLSRLSREISIENQ